MTASTKKSSLVYLSRYISPACEYDILRKVPQFEDFDNTSLHMAQVDQIKCQSTVFSIRSPDFINE